MARDLANEEYINKRAEDHNDWLAKVDVAWKTRGVRLPYPPFVPFPTETDIVSRAVTLYKFVISTAAAGVPESLPIEPTPVTTPPAVVPPIEPTPVTTPPAVVPPIEPTPVKRALSWKTFVDHTVEVNDIVVETPSEPPSVTSSVFDAAYNPVAQPEDLSTPEDLPTPEDVISETETVSTVTDTVEEQLDPTVKSPNKPALTGIKNLLALGWLKNSNDKGT